MLPTVRISSGNWLAMLLLLAVVGVFASELSADSDKFDRATRVSPMGSFPYSLAYMRMMRPAPSSIRPIASYQWLSRAEAAHDLADLIDGLDEGRFMDRERRSTGPVYKRYACRFKFCRIFDA